jgi:hypothetical protein
LEAERIAIRTEFPKFNRVHNGCRSPEQELADLRKRALKAGTEERRRIRGEYKHVSAMVITALGGK